MKEGLTEEEKEFVLELAKEAMEHWNPKMVTSPKTAFVAGFVLGHNIGEGKGLKEAIDAFTSPHKDRTFCGCCGGECAGKDGEECDVCNGSGLEATEHE